MELQRGWGTHTLFSKSQASQKQTFWLPIHTPTPTCAFVAWWHLWLCGVVLVDSAQERTARWSSPLQQLSIPDDPPTSGQRVHTISHLDHDIPHSTKIRWQVCTATCHSFLCERPSATRSQSPSLGGGFHSGKLCAPLTSGLRASATSGWRCRKPGMRHGWCGSGAGL